MVERKLITSQFWYYLHVRETFPKSWTPYVGIIHNDAMLCFLTSTRTYKCVQSKKQFVRRNRSFITCIFLRKATFAQLNPSRRHAQKKALISIRRRTADRMERSMDLSFVFRCVFSWLHECCVFVCFLSFFWKRRKTKIFFGWVKLF